MKRPTAQRLVRQIALASLASLTMILLLSRLASADADQGLTNAEFIRGDLNDDTVIDLSDAQALVNYLFLGEEGPPCEDISDVNDDGLVNIADAAHLLGYLYWGGEAPPEPFDEPGGDPTHDDPFECGDTCEPLTCDEAGAECGLVSDGCGGQLNCGNSCSSNVCDDGLCQERSCYDGVRNGTETDVDCGGSDCQFRDCAIGRNCVRDGDCSSGNCDGGTCSARSNACTSGPCRWVPGSRGMQRICTPLPRRGQCWGDFDCNGNSPCHNAYVGTTSCRAGYCS
ncbi:MAG: hypothetical protein CL928_02950 [Deltaproteobacteria bacterium]|nr:hypothetical protein [Deltaproteobacteria bacterium]